MQASVEFPHSNTVGTLLVYNIGIMNYCHKPFENRRIITTVRKRRQLFLSTKSAIKEKKVCIDKSDSSAGYTYSRRGTGGRFHYD
jgi:hypothetical protein